MVIVPVPLISLQVIVNVDPVAVTDPRLVKLTGEVGLVVSLIVAKDASDNVITYALSDALVPRFVPVVVCGIIVAVFFPVVLKYKLSVLSILVILGISGTVPGVTPDRVTSLYRMVWVSSGVASRTGIFSIILP
jgi:hypothetical protein